MKIFLLVLATIIFIVACIYLFNRISGEPFCEILLAILLSCSVAFMWVAGYFQPMEIEKASTYEPTPLDSVQEIILVDTDGNEFYFDILEVE